MQGIIPAGPAIQNAAFGKERVKQNADWREPAQAANAVAALELFARSFEEIAGLGLRITLLRIEPARQWLAVVVIDDA